MMRYTDHPGGWTAPATGMTWGLWSDIPLSQWGQVDPWVRVTRGSFRVT